jgi:hypothetical protein
MITQSQLNTCRRVADYLRKTAMPFLADIYADRDAETEKKQAIQSIIDFADHAVKLADDFKKLMDMFVDLQREQENAKRK